MAAPANAPVRQPGGLLRRFLADERGATALEYGMICALVVVAVAGTVRMIADSYYTKVLTPLTSSMSSQ